jgi:twitching motility protein PilT
VAEASIEDLLEKTIEAGCSDLHVQVGMPPAMRLHGVLMPMDHPPTTAEAAKQYLKHIANEKLIKEILEHGSADFSFQTQKKSRFRVNAFKQRGALAIAFRTISTIIPTFEDLNLPPVVAEIADEERGLVLVTGTTGSGKSTTLAAMIDWINQRKAKRVITIEDPIEYLHSNKKSLIAQRELGLDARSFDEALRHVLRQDPDIILIGELRDLPTIRVSMRAAETGHLVFSTLHTGNASQTVDRIISYYPPEQHDLIRKQLALNLKAVISQRLLRRIDVLGRAPAIEILRITPIVQKMVLEGKTKELHQAIQNAERGMQTFDQCLVEMVKKQMVSQEEAEMNATNLPALRRILAGGYSDSDKTSIISF